MQLKIYSVTVRDKVFCITALSAEEVKPECLTTWTLNLRPYTGSASLQLAQRMAKSDCFNQSGVGDQLSITATRGKFLIETLLESGLVQTGDIPEPLSVQDIPASVCREVNAAIDGTYLTESDFSALKKGQ